MPTQVQIIAANLRREKNEWSLDNSQISEEGLKANALFKYLVEEGDIVPLTDDDKKEKQGLTKRLEVLESQLEEDNANETLIRQQIEQVEDELKLYDSYRDVYDLIPETYSHYSMDNFSVNGESTEYAVGDEREVQLSAEEYMENMLDDIGYEGFSESFVEGFVDEDQVVNYFRDMFTDMVYDDPENFLPEEKQQLSGNQEGVISFKETKISQLQKEIETLSIFLENTKNKKQKTQLTEKLTELEELISEVNDEIQEIKDTPLGDFLDEDIEEYIESMVEDVQRDPIGHLKDNDFEIDRFIDRSSFIEGVIESDGYEFISPYNGVVGESSANGKWFYIVRVD
jgi:hypothetical protein